mmetsp:Transcript_13601/g.26128  ORF Transcript_13601/g.26128 Transcript_13601/m.26128 type:complete len:161 (-) Transcript_13601:410-892(-)
MLLTVRDHAVYRPRALFGANLPVQASADDTVRAVKERILDLAGIPLEEQVLIFEGDMKQNSRLVELDAVRRRQFMWNQLLDSPLRRLELENDRTLRHYHIEADAELLLIDTHPTAQRPPSGLPPTTDAPATTDAAAPTEEHSTAESAQPCAPRDMWPYEL